MVRSEALLGIHHFQEQLHSRIGGYIDDPSGLLAIFITADIDLEVRCFGTARTDEVRTKGTLAMTRRAGGFRAVG